MYLLIEVIEDMAAAAWAKYIWTKSEEDGQQKAFGDG